MGFDEARVVQMRVLRNPEKHIYGFGSGYVIAPGLVLTAAHVLEPQKGTPAEKAQPCEVRAWRSAVWSPALVHWVDPALEVAVVMCATCALPGGVQWGRLTGVHHVDWTAVGFPVASVEDTGRQAEQAWGEASPLSAAESGRLALTVTSREAEDVTPGQSGWAGLSGAAVFCNDHLVGVMQADPARYAKSLEARRVETFLFVPELSALLSEPSCDEIRGDPPEPGLQSGFPGIMAGALGQADPVAEVTSSLSDAGRSQSPILIAIDETEDPLTDAQFSLSERHLTVTLSATQVASAVGIIDKIGRAASIGEIVGAGHRVWAILLSAEPRLANLLDCIGDSGVRQPVAWCGRASLLGRLGAALGVAHTGRDGETGFVSIRAGAHYFLPVPERPDSRTMAHRSGIAEPVVERRVVSKDDPQQNASFVREASSAEVAIFIDPNPTSGAVAELAGLVRSERLSTTRAAFAFVTSTPGAEEIDRLLDTLPFVSFGHIDLAEPGVLAALESSLRQHAATFALPSIAAAVRAAAVRRAIAADDGRGCLAALQWSTWSWVGLPLFSRGYEEIPPAAYPHLMLLRSVASHDWYFNRRKGIPDAYAADTLARADLPEQEKFHLYLSGAGGTGKSCFLRYVHDELAQRENVIPVWYRVDAPSSSWENIRDRVREETVIAVRNRCAESAAEEIATISGGLGIFLREAVKRLRRSYPSLEIAVFIDQLERTFESGDQPDAVRLETISNAVADLLKTVEVGQGIRIFVASRKQYLPDFLGSSRTATEAGLEFNVLQTISDSTEQVGFVRKIVSWCLDNQLVDPTFSIEGQAALTLVLKVDGHPLNMVLALIQLLSANLRGTITEEQLTSQYRPWERLFDLDLRAASHDDLDWYFLLAMAHARTEIVSFDEVWWRLRMIDARLTRRVEDLRPPGVIERLWLFGYLGRTLYARPAGGNAAGFVEFFHANLRDYILREVITRGRPAFDIADRHLGTPATWGALDRLAGRAHDWEQTQQLLPADDIRVLMEHRHQVIEAHTIPGLRDARRFSLLFLRDRDRAREGLCQAALECFVFSALVHDDRGRWAFETLFPDADHRLAVCERWLSRGTSASRPALLRYLIEAESEAARSKLISLVLDETGPRGADIARTLAAILAEPLFAARYRNAFVANLIEVAASLGGRHAGRLSQRAKSFIVASCAGDRDALVGVMAYCADWFGSDESITVQQARAALSSSEVDDWLASADDETLGGAALAEPAAAQDDAVLGLVVGANLESAIDHARLSAWSRELRRRLAVPFPDLQIIRGEAEPPPPGDERRNAVTPSAQDPDAIELRGPMGRISSNIFHADRECVLRRHWDATGEVLPADAAKGYDVAGEEDVVWVSLSEEQRGTFPFPRWKFDEAVDDWLERHVRRSFDALFNDDLLIEFYRDIVSAPGIRARWRGVAPRLLRRIVVELVEEGVPFGPRRDAIFEVVAGLTGTVAQPELLAEKVREHLKGDICRAVADEAGQMTVLLLDAGLEQELADLVRVQGDRMVLALEPSDARQVAAAARRSVEKLLKELAPPPVVVTLPSLRRSLARLLRQFDHRVPVLSFTELAPDIITVPGEVIGSPDLVRARPVQPDVQQQAQRI
jgi:hypothetical protein